MLRTAVVTAVVSAAALALGAPPATAAAKIERVVATPAFHHVQEAVASKDGRYVVVAANPTAPVVVAGQTAPNLGNTPVAGPTFATPLEQVYVVDRVAKTARLASAAKNGTPGDRDASTVSISADGRYVTFVSSATNLLPRPVPPPLGTRAAYLYDRVARKLTRVSLDWHGAEFDVVGVSISGDGSTILLATGAAVLKGDKPGGTAVFARDRRTGRYATVTRTKAGAVARSYSMSAARPSRTGRYVAVASSALLNGAYGPESVGTSGNVYLFDTKTGSAKLVRGNTADDARCPQQLLDANSCAYTVGGVAVDTEGTRVAYVVTTSAFGVPLGTRVVSVDMPSGQATVLATPATDATGLAYALDGASLYFVAPPANTDSATGSLVLYRGTIATHALRVVTTLPVASSCRTDGCATARVSAPAPFANGVAFATDAPLTSDDTNGLMDAYVSTG